MSEAGNTTVPLPPCGGGLGRGVNANLSDVAGDPTQASLAAGLADRSFAISPARGEKGGAVVRGPASPTAKAGDR
jgi:hypothetical protein